MIAALQVSLDGFTQGEDRGEPPWVESWSDALQLVPDVDAFVQGAGMFPGYGEAWAAIEANPKGVAPFLGREPSHQEIAYARLAAKTPHYVVSRTLKSVSWPKTAKIVRELSELGVVKNQPGKNIYVVGGPTLVTGLLNEGLLDEIRLILHPLLLGRGRSLFAGVTQRRKLEFVKAEPWKSGKLVLTYRT